MDCHDPVCQLALGGAVVAIPKALQRFRSRPGDSGDDKGRPNRSGNLDDSIFPISTTGWLAVFGLAVIGEVMGHGLIVYSLKYFSSAFVTIVLLLEPAPAAAVAWFLFGEFLDPLNIGGFILITLGIYLAKTGTGSDGADKNNRTTQVPEQLVEGTIEP